MSYHYRLRTHRSPSAPLSPTMAVQRETRQRVAIRSVLRGAKRPLSPHEVLAQARLAVRAVGMATVYRNLKRLVAEGTVHVIHLPGESPRYEPSSLAHHHHFQCTALRSRLRRSRLPGNAAPPAPSGFTVEHHDVTLYGRCADCASARASRRHDDSRRTAALRLQRRRRGAAARAFRPGARGATFSSSVRPAAARPRSSISSPDCCCPRAAPSSSTIRTCRRSLRRRAIASAAVTSASCCSSSISCRRSPRCRTCWSRRASPAFPSIVPAADADARGARRRRARPTPTRISSRSASSNASRSPGRWSIVPSCCLPTSRLRISTTNPAPR